MESLSVDRSYTEGLMLWVESLQARDNHISQTNIEPVCYYHVDAPYNILLVTPETCNRHLNLS